MSHLQYIPVALYTVGVCHYGHKEPYRTVEVEADNRNIAWGLGRVELQPSINESICVVGFKPNPRYLEWRSEYRKANGLPDD